MNFEAKIQEIKTIFLKATKTLIFLSALTPLIFVKESILPFIVGKTLFFRTLMVLAFACFFIFKILSHKNLSSFFSDFKNKGKEVLKKPIFLGVSLLFFSGIVSVLLAVNRGPALWGTLERGEGLITLISYVALFFIAQSVFNQKDWLNFFKTTMIVGFWTALYGILQYFGLKNIPFAPLAEPGARPESYIGNAAFFSAYLILVIASAFIVFRAASLEESVKKEESRDKDSFWKFLSLLTVIASIFSIFLASTRGAILGLFAGFIGLLLFYSFISQKSKLLFNPRISKKTARATIFVLVLLVALFWLTRTNVFWQSIPGINRIVTISPLNFKDSSVQTRLITWRVSLNAFLEKPIFGWGLENYLTAYSKHYDPKYTIYGEVWFDRAHNKILEVMVTQGILGLFAFLSFWSAIFYTIRKKPLITAIFIAYFVQNLFLFDEVNSSLLLFALLSFLSVNKANTRQEDDSRDPVLMLPNKISSINVILAVVVAIASLYFFKTYLYQPFLQSRSAFAATNTSLNKKDEILKKIQKAFYPDNFAQISIRANVFDNFYKEKIAVFEDSDFDEIAQILSKGLSETIEHYPSYDPRFYIRANQMLDTLAKRSPELYKFAESAARKGLELAPKRQEIYFGLAFSLAGQEKFEEAIKVIKDAIGLQPNFSRSYYHLGLMYAVAGKKNEALKAFEEVERLNPNLDLNKSDREGMALTYKVFGRIDKLAYLVSKYAENTGNGAINLDPEYFLLTLKYYIGKKDAPNAFKIAKALSIVPELKDDMETLTNLIKNQEWNILKKL